MAQAEAQETYYRTLRTMREVAEAVRTQPDEEVGALRVLADRIDIERRWLRASLAAGYEPGRPPAWFCGGKH